MNREFFALKVETADGSKRVYFLHHVVGFDYTNQELLLSTGEKVEIKSSWEKIVNDYSRYGVIKEV